MSDQRLPYDDPSTPSQMHADCRVAERNLCLQRAARQAVRPAPSLLFDERPREVHKPQIEVSQAAARLAAALNLQLDGD